MPRTRASSAGGGGGAPVAVGTYTGDGNLTQGIAGVGFPPIFVIVYKQSTVAGGANMFDVAMKTNQNGLYASELYIGTWDIWYSRFAIISLDADGFTVGDATALWGFNAFNVLGEVYTYVAFGA